MKRIMAGDEGIAMLTVIGVMLVVTALSIGSFTLARQALFSSVRVEDESRAFRAASTGLDTIISQFTEEMTGFPKTGVTDDGSYSVDLIDLGGGEFRLVSTGTGLDSREETVTQQFYYMNLWRMNFAGTGPQSLLSGTSGLNGTSNILGPFYMKGNFRVDSNMSVREGPLFVRGGAISVASSGLLGSPAVPIKVFCDKSVPANNPAGANRGVYIATISRSVPDITLPTLNMGQMDYWASKARSESIDNVMNNQFAPAAGVEALGTDATTYTSVIPPTASPAWSRTKASLTSPNSCYKFIGRADGSLAPMGQGAHDLVIGGRTFGSWGSVNTTDGVYIAGDGHYPYANAHDDFAYDNVNNILYIEGTVFVDGDVTISENMTYVGNGTIIANGTITLDGAVRPHGTNAQGENNQWALGLVTPTEMYFTANDSNNYSTKTETELRASTPTFAGAFYAQGTVYYTSTNMLMRGSIIAGKISSSSPNTYMVTNPLLPEYLPESLPGVDIGLLFPGLWTRG
jgi:hypothetical protein